MVQKSCSPSPQGDFPEKVVVSWTLGDRFGQTGLLEQRTGGVRQECPELLESGRGGEGRVPELSPEDRGLIWGEWEGVRHLGL